MIRKILILTMISCGAIVLNAQSRSLSSAAKNVSKKDTAKTESTDTTKKLTAYEKLFDKKKSVTTSKGIITLHNIEGKVYFEFPVKLMGKSFLMSSLVDNVSDMSLSYAGQRASRPSHICFTKTDSLVQIRLVPVPKIVDSEDAGIQKAVDMSALPSVINSSPIAAYNKDSSAVVFDVTSFFVSGSKYIGTLNASSFGGFIQKVSTFSKDLSALNTVEAYEDNVAVISNMTYTFKTFFLGMESGGSEYLTVEMRTTLTLLPEEPSKYRIADYRIGTGVTAFEKFSSDEQGSSASYMANRWRLEPKDIDAHRSGKLTEPVKPIVFYIDTLFIPSWREAIKRGLLKWNESFEKIGFKDVIKVYDYPSKSTDSTFSASNSSYNCVRYAQNPARGIGRTINTDPRTGEILSASILFFRDSPVTLQRERIYQTAAVEPDVRGYELPDNLMENSIELAMTREMGFCLGLTANLAASSWMPVDSLRSATFTQREGITSSVMDQIKYNYVAQPGDIEKGVKLTADKPGVYDHYAVEWLYKPIYEAKTAAEEESILRDMITSKRNDPRFYYGREQSWSAYFDPRSMVEDLGNDPVKAAQYGINTLKYVSANATKWVNKNEADESYRELFIDFIFLKLYDYYRSLMVNIGGIEINSRYEGDPAPSYIPVDKRIQKESLAFMLNQADDLTWADNKELLVMSGMNSSFSRYLSNNLVRLAFQRIPMVAFAQTKSADPYTVDEMLSDITEFSFKNLSRGVDPSDAQKGALYALAQVLLGGSELPNVINARAKNRMAFQFTDDDNYMSYANIRARCFPDEVVLNNESDLLMNTDLHQVQSADNNNLLFERSAFDPLVSIKYLVPTNLAPVYYKHLTDLRSKLKSSRSRVKSDSTKAMIDYLIISIDKGIGKN